MGTGVQYDIMAIGRRRQQLLKTGILPQDALEQAFNFFAVPQDDRNGIVLEIKKLEESHQTPPAKRSVPRDRTRNLDRAPFAPTVRRGEKTEVLVDYKRRAAGDN
jgi:hypothetical protein